MRRSTPVLAIALALLPSWLNAQEPLPKEVQALGAWVGEWTYTMSTQESAGTMSFEWFGDRFMTAEEHTPRGSEIRHMMGYDPAAGVYIWRRYWSTGLVDVGQGWLHDNAWTFLFLGDVGTLRRMTMTFETPDVLAFKWERSVEGGPWQVMSEGKTTRTR